MGFFDCKRPDVNAARRGLSLSDPIVAA